MLHGMAFLVSLYMTTAGMYTLGLIRRKHTILPCNEGFPDSYLAYCSFSPSIAATVASYRYLTWTLSSCSPNRTNWPSAHNSVYFLVRLVYKLLLRSSPRDVKCMPPVCDVCRVPRMLLLISRFPQSQCERYVLRLLVDKTAVVLICDWWSVSPVRRIADSCGGDMASSDVVRCTLERKKECSLLDRPPRNQIRKCHHQLSLQS